MSSLIERLDELDRDRRVAKAVVDRAPIGKSDLLAVGQLSEFEAAFHAALDDAWPDIREALSVVMMLYADDSAWHGWRPIKQALRRLTEDRP